MTTPKNPKKYRFEIGSPLDDYPSSMSSELTIKDLEQQAAKRKNLTTQSRFKPISIQGSIKHASLIYK